MPIPKPKAKASEDEDINWVDNQEKGYILY